MCFTTFIYIVQFCLFAFSPPKFPLQPLRRHILGFGVSSFFFLLFISIWNSRLYLYNTRRCSMVYQIELKPTYCSVNAIHWKLYDWICMMYMQFINLFQSFAFRGLSYSSYLLFLHFSFSFSHHKKFPTSQPRDSKCTMQSENGIIVHTQISLNDRIYSYFVAANFFAWSSFFDLLGVWKWEVSIRCSFSGDDAPSPFKKYSASVGSLVSNLEPRV